HGDDRRAERGCGDPERGKRHGPGGAGFDAEGRPRRDRHAQRMRNRFSPGKAARSASAAGQIIATRPLRAGIGYNGRVIVARGVLLSMPLAAGYGRPAPDAALLYERGMLAWPGGAARAACGRGGVRLDKREGDGASPAGTFPLVAAFYRADRIAKPQTALPLAAFRPHDAWVDEPADANYNRLVALPYLARTEALWRHDARYDL